VFRAFGRIVRPGSIAAAVHSGAICIAATSFATVGLDDLLNQMAKP